MSWAAVACGIIGPPMNILALGGAGLEQPIHFQPCRYCQRAPDKGQKEANCRGCGAALEEKKP